MKTSLGDNVNFNGGVTARVVDGSSVDLGDRHDDDMRLFNTRISERNLKERDGEEGEKKRREKWKQQKDK